MDKKDKPKTIIYLNQDKHAPVPRVEVAESKGGGHYIAVYALNSADLAPLQQKLEDDGIISIMTHEGQAVMVLHTDKPEQLIDKLQLNTQGSLIKEEKEKSWWQEMDLINVRGWVGNIGQAFMIASGFLDRDKKGKFDWREPNGRAKIMSAGISFIGNSVNAKYGVQKKTDTLREKFAKNHINKMLVESGNVDESKLASVEDKLTEDENKEKPSWMDQNSLKFSNGIKLIGKIALASAPRKDLYMAGWLSIISKLVTLSGKDEDPFKLEKDQSLLAQARRHSNLIAGPLEWIANITLFMGSMLEPRDKTKKAPKASLFRLPQKDDLKLFDLEENKFRKAKDIQWFQFLGAFTIFGSLTAKSLAPFTSKKIDVEEFTAHTAHGLAQVDTEKRNQLLGDTVVKIMNTRELPEMHELGFAGTFTKIADDLEFRQGIAVRTNRAPIAYNSNEKGAKKPTAEKQGKATKVPAEKAEHKDKTTTSPNVKKRNETEVMGLTHLTEAALGNTEEAQRITDAIKDPAKNASDIHKLAVEANERLLSDSTLAPTNVVKNLTEKGSNYLEDIRNGQHKEALIEAGVA